jgi:hypothetical protein
MRRRRKLLARRIIALGRASPPPCFAWSPSPVARGRTTDIVLAAQSAPGFCRSRSPDGAERNPGAAFRLIDRSPDYAALHPGYEQKGGETPTSAWVHPPRHRARRASSGTRSPVGVPPRLSSVGRYRPFGATPGQASWDVAGRSILYGRLNRETETSRS